MAYVTSIERLAEVRGAANAYLISLAEICGPLPTSMQDRIRNLDGEQLEQLGRDFLRFESLADLEGWLRQRAGGEV